MSAGPSMTCEQCRELLIELVCDELPAGSAAEVRAHALRCERCGPELEKLGATLRVSRELPLLTPSPELERRIMQAAREAIAGRARGPARETPTPNTSGITAWFARLGSFAMSPQVAMASVLLLVVGIGLYALPLGHEPESTALRATEEDAEHDREGVNAPSSAAPAPAASATATPIVPPEQERSAESSWRREPRGASGEGQAMRSANGRADDLSGGLGSLAKSKGNVARAFPESKAASSSPKDEHSKVYAAKPSAPAKVSTNKLEEADGIGDRFAEPAQPPAGGGGAVDKRARGEMAQAAPKAAPAPAAPKAALAPAAEYAPAPPATAGSVASSEAKESEAARPAKAQPTQPARSKKDEGSGLSQGVAAARRGDYALAEALLTPLLSSGTAQERDEARLWLARSWRARGDCARALGYYRTLTQAVTAQRAVLEEAADCNERTGNGATAAKLRARAALPAKQ